MKDKAKDKGWLIESIGQIGRKYERKKLIKKNYIPQSRIIWNRLEKIAGVNFVRLLGELAFSLIIILIFPM